MRTSIHLITLLSTATCVQAGWEVFNGLTDLDRIPGMNRLSQYIFRTNQMGPDYNNVADASSNPNCETEVGNRLIPASNFKRPRNYSIPDCYPDLDTWKRECNAESYCLYNRLSSNSNNNYVFGSDCKGVRIGMTGREIGLDIAFLNSFVPHLETLDIYGYSTVLHLLAEAAVRRNTIKHLRIRYCKLNKESLEKVFSLNLEILELSKVDLSLFDSDISIDNLKNSLRLLKLHNCRMSSALIKKLAGLGNLEELDLSMNEQHLFDDLLEDVDLSKSALKKLNLEWCCLTPRFIRNLSGFKHLEDLNLYNVHFPSGDKNVNFGSLKSTLKRLNLKSYTANISILMKELPEFERLDDLNMSGCDFSDHCEDLDFGKAKATLKRFDVGDCRLDPVILMDKLSGFEQLEDLNISNNSLWYLGEDFSFGNLGKTLKRLNMFSCHANSSVLRKLTGFENLEELNLKCNNLSFLDGSFEFGNLKKTLRKLYLGKCNLRVSVTKQLADFERLEDLSLESNVLSPIGSQIISGSEAFTFGRLRKTLKRLNLALCAMNPQTIQELELFEQLEALNLESVNLSCVNTDFNLENLKKTLKQLVIRYCLLNENAKKHLRDNIPNTLC